MGPIVAAFPPSTTAQPLELALALALASPGLFLVVISATKKATLLIAR